MPELAQPAAPARRGRQRGSTRRRRGAGDGAPRFWPRRPPILGRIHAAKLARSPPPRKLTKWGAGVGKQLQEKPTVTNYGNNKYQDRQSAEDGIEGCSANSRRRIERAMDALRDLLFVASKQRGPRWWFDVGQRVERILLLSGGKEKTTSNLRYAQAGATQNDKGWMAYHIESLGGQRPMLKQARRADYPSLRSGVTDSIRRLEQVQEAVEVELRQLENPFLPRPAERSSIRRSTRPCFRAIKSAMVAMVGGRPLCRFANSCPAPPHRNLTEESEPLDKFATRVKLRKPAQGDSSLPAQS